MVNLPSWRRRKNAPAKTTRKDNIRINDAPSTDATTESDEQADQGGYNSPPNFSSSSSRRRRPPPAPPQQSSTNMLLFPTKPKTSSGRLSATLSHLRGENNDAAYNNRAANRGGEGKLESNNKRPTSATAARRARSAPPTQRHGRSRSAPPPDIQRHDGRSHAASKKKEGEQQQRRQRRKERSSSDDRRTRPSHDFLDQRRQQQRMRRSRTVPPNSKQRVSTRHDNVESSRSKHHHHHRPSESCKRKEEYTNYIQRQGRKSSSNMNQQRSHSTKRFSSTQRDKPGNHRKDKREKSHPPSSRRNPSRRMEEPTRRSSRHKRSEDHARRTRSSLARTRSRRRRDQNDPPEGHPNRTHSSRRQDEKRHHRRVRSEDPRRTSGKSRQQGEEQPIMPHPSSSRREHSRSRPQSPRHGRRRARSAGPLALVPEDGRRIRRSPSFSSGKSLLFLTDGRSLVTRSLSPYRSGNRRHHDEPLLLTDGNEKGEASGGLRERDKFDFPPMRSDRIPFLDHERSERDRVSGRHRHNNQGQDQGQDRRRQYRGQRSNGQNNNMDSSIAMLSFKAAATRHRDMPRHQKISDNSTGPSSVLAPRRSKSHDVRHQGSRGPRSQDVRVNNTSRQAPRRSKSPTATNMQRGQQVTRKTLPANNTASGATISSGRDQAREIRSGHHRTRRSISQQHGTRRSTSQHGSRHHQDERPSTNLENKLERIREQPPMLSDNMNNPSEDGLMMKDPREDVDIHKVDDAVVQRNLEKKPRRIREQRRMMYDVDHPPEDEITTKDPREDVDIHKVDDVVQSIIRRNSQNGPLSKEHPSKPHGRSRTDNWDPPKSTARDPLTQSIDNNGAENEIQRDPIIQSIDTDDGTRRVTASRSFHAAWPPPPPPSQGASIRSCHISRSLGGSKRSGMSPRGVPPPPPRRKSLSSSTPSTPPSDTASSINEPGPEPINSATARAQGLEDVVNLLYSDIFGGSGLYTGECDQFGRPNGQGKINYDNGKSFKGSWMNGVPNAVEFRQQNSPPVAQQYPNVATYAAAGSGSVCPGGNNTLASGSMAGATFAQNQGSLLYVAQPGPASHMMNGAAGVAQPMYVNPMYGGYNQVMQRGAPMMNYQGGQVMGQGMRVMSPHHQMMNSQAAMMGQGMGPPMSGYAAPRQQMSPHIGHGNIP